MCNGMAQPDKALACVHKFRQFNWQVAPQKHIVKVLKERLRIKLSTVLSKSKCYSMSCIYILELNLKTSIKQYVKIYFTIGLKF